MKRYPPMDMALTALLVASKAEETYKKIRQILTAAVTLLNPSAQVDQVDGAIVEEHRRRVVALEEGLLTTIGFNLDSHPHAHEALLELARELKLYNTPNMLHSALRMLNRMYLTDLVICYTPMQLAGAALKEAMDEMNFSRRNLLWQLTNTFMVNTDDLRTLTQHYRQQIELTNKK